ncbi:UDP-2,4-diacetamido-2,4,6-trideoxy-beta-L-altropyranose hydrolase [Halomonas saccharevitans]|uniref:UDP-2,4-diacetamido-2,4,6-trideoxy-beta-L-altropyranose hydrolase n=1 Tax=Halomonas saccharevitans TaxID=416872 RepID=A0A1I7B405_9GAMM|nr:UDP-2,4-diacetamido-2,4,6-trideoxy-beta-L-altropyranose hydrolase [Halomonas saccharevitans]SFT81901.1 UDP-2,4-diacetamido-2,4,6-trideoxy-beta-L-altropyranose hydrolase [Halomonas saccharevitans]
MNELYAAAPVIAFRADASRLIGSGHVMRCLTLADALAAQGADCHFLCRVHDGHLIERISAHGHRVHRLSLPDEPDGEGASPAVTEDVPAHADWLGVAWAVDAEQSRHVLAALQPDWLVVDHYALDERWEDIVTPGGCRVLVIDDLADRAHRADLLLDQNLGRRAVDYADLVPEGCRVLVGPTYALLRPEFADWREASLARRQGQPRLERLLITLGGVDQDNVTGRVLEVVSQCPLPDDLQITVVMGATAPWLDDVRAQARWMAWPTEVVVNVDDMARRMAEADLGIGAAGSTSWERCCLGLPTVMVALAENQVEIARHLDEAQAAIHVGTTATSIWADRLQRVMAEITAAPARLDAMTHHAAGLTEGQGAQALVEHLLRDG